MDGFAGLESVTKDATNQPTMPHYEARPVPGDMTRITRSGLVHSLVSRYEQWYIQELTEGVPVSRTDTIQPQLVQAIWVVSLCKAFPSLSDFPHERLRWYASARTARSFSEKCAVDAFLASTLLPLGLRTRFQCCALKRLFSRAVTRCSQQRYL